MPLNATQTLIRSRLEWGSLIPGNEVRELMKLLGHVTAS